MISKIASMIFLGKPLLIDSGILALILFMATAAIGALNHRGNFTVPFKWHPRLARIALVVGIIHALFALSFLYNF
jgi:hypothetical protein